MLQASLGDGLALDPFALDYFALKVAQFTASMAAAIGGIEALVFTGGVGEHAAPLRDGIVERLCFLGAFEVIVIKANEERVMALQALICLAAEGQGR